MTGPGGAERNHVAVCGVCGKLGYSTKPAAKDARRRTLRAGSKARKAGAVLRVYPCRTENGSNGLWHVGHSVPRGASLNDPAVRFLPDEGRTARA